MTFEELCEEYEQVHVSTLSESSRESFKWQKKNLLETFSGLMLTEIDTRLIEEYKLQRRKQPSKNNSRRTVKGATVNRELETLQTMFKLAKQRK